MGNCFAGASANDPDGQINQSISNHMQLAQKDASNAHNVLLLGPGDSGKSTILKQMMCIHGIMSTHDHRRLIVEKVVEYMVILCKYSRDLNILLTSADNEDDADTVNASLEYMLSLPSPCDINIEIAAHMKRLWAASGIQSTLAQREKYRIQIPDNVAYFFDERLDDIASDSYEPTFDDCLRVRSRTTGVFQQQFAVLMTENGSFPLNENGDDVVGGSGDFAEPKHGQKPAPLLPSDSGQQSSKKKYRNGEVHKFNVIDVGGQRAERKKWINHLSDNVEAVIYVVAISEYDMTCFEDSNTLRLHEALTLFADVLKKGFMQDKSVTIFFNKYDLFQEKLKDPEQATIDEFFDDFPADAKNPRNADDVVEFVYKKFVALYNEAHTSSISPPHFHCTYALDTEQVDKLMVGMQTDLIKRNLKRIAGF
eukprot:CAMPEP_0202688134 /NCGR_PEP_ID=MMETSP1385-20130828/3660_1 /ASSEMBLY_ACC=CAM_ASM_000861 /TAXON_ID=933848 /ORGANISM="Elphidium margaritaceum" /LENGTH=423 /DNA_ID=CAMNT_0049343033 /DNA_START=50 /DNA_END=1321 /DNA_ORIENTATION=+